MKEDIIEVLEQFKYGNYSTEQAANELFDLYNVSGIEKLLRYVKRQKDYCEMKSLETDHKTDKYSKDGIYTKEQMSGYYQGRGEANCSIIYQIQNILKEIK